MLQLRQGFGRLIRSHEDQGVVAILDPRLRTKPYGRAFLAALPRCPMVEDRAGVAAFFGAARASDRVAFSELPCRGGGTGRRVRLKTGCPMRAWGFEPLPRHSPQCFPCQVQSFRDRGRASGNHAGVGHAALPAGAYPARAGTARRADLARRRRAPSLSRACGDPHAAGADGRRQRPLVSRLPRAAFLGARADEGRDPLRRGGLARRVRGARDVDDLEVRAPAPALRRRERRRALQPASALPARARARDAPVHLRPRAVHRAGDRHPGARTSRRTSRRWPG